MISLCVEFMVGQLFVHDYLLHDSLSLAWLLVACRYGTHMYPLTPRFLVLVDYPSLVSRVVWESFPTVCLRPI